MTDRKYCEDCRFFISHKDLSLAQCSYPQKNDAGLALIVRDPPPQPPRRWAATERQHNNDDSCGTDAKWFEPKLSIAAGA